VRRIRMFLALILLLSMFTGCAREESVPTIHGMPRRDTADTGEAVESAPVEIIREPEISIDAGTLPPIRVNLCAFGDIMAHDGTYGAAKVGDTYDFDYMFADLVPYTADADYLVGNLETTFAGADRGYSSYPHFNTPEQMAESMAKVLGLDLLSTASNHSFDSNVSGLKTTLDNLDRYGIAHTGTYRTREESEELFFAEIEGATFAFLSYTYGLNGINPNDYSVNVISRDALQQDAAAAREAGADVVVALLHWGTEYHRTASKDQRNLAEWLFSNTEIDLIIGNHPHVVQPMEEFRVTYDGQEKIGYVCYALGNFTSEQLFEYSNTGIMVNVHFVIDREDHHKNRVEAITYTPIFVDPNPKATGKRYRVIAITQAIADYEAGTDPHISTQEYNQLVKYREEYAEMFSTVEIVQEFTLP